VRIRSVAAGLGAVIGGATLLAACSSSPSTSTTTSTTRAAAATTTKPTTSPNSGTVTTTTKPAFLTKTGTGNASVPVSHSSKWNVRWHFNCGSTRKPFALTLKENGGATKKIYSATGLGGGGIQPVNKGSYTAVITTSCAWTLWGYPA
jgi:hypothetical protein